MTTFDPIIADIRFGCGLKPSQANYESVDQMLRRLAGPDEMAARYPIPVFDTYRQQLLDAGAIGKAARIEDPPKRLKAAKALRNQVKVEQVKWFRAHLSRRLDTTDGLRERLSFFWADHFTAVGKASFLISLNAPYVEESIRPHVSGRFVDMLKAVVRAPLMLKYLDQTRSIGPNSVSAGRRKVPSGLNENLAREMLELHTLGVTGPYNQTDVRELAELLTGLNFSQDRGFVFSRPMAEPGPETVLGLLYGGEKANLADIDAVLEDLAAHPGTAEHIATKLARHFIGDTPDAEMIAAMTERFLETGGFLPDVYKAMLTHPAAWGRSAGNVKQPIDFVATSLRALGCGEAQLADLDQKMLSSRLIRPLARMGQVWEKPPGPDGWPEEDRSWITPPRYAARVQWAMTIPQSFVRPLPDPRDFVKSALGGRAPESAVFAASAAEDRAGGIGVVLSSPAFQRT